MLMDIHGQQKGSLTTINFWQNQIQAFFRERVSRQHFRNQRNLFPKGLDKVVSNKVRKEPLQRTWRAQNLKKQAHSGDNIVTV